MSEPIPIIGIVQENLLFLIPLTFDDFLPLQTQKQGEGSLNL
jgi:hypothetical protein